MTTQESVVAERVDIDEQTLKHASLLVKVTWVVLIVGLILGAIVFWGVGEALGQDIGALIWIASFAGAVALISIRQLLLGERE